MRVSFVSRYVVSSGGVPLVALSSWKGQVHTDALSDCVMQELGLPLHGAFFGNTHGDADAGAAAAQA